jgi:hypothetical protein
MKSPLALFLLMIFSFCFVLIGLASVDSIVVQLQSAGFSESWIEKNWAIIALVLSEILAVVPTKSKGIVHYVVLILRRIFSRSKK